MSQKLEPSVVVEDEPRSKHQKINAEERQRRIKIYVKKSLI